MSLVLCRTSWHKTRSTLFLRGQTFSSQRLPKRLQRLQRSFAKFRRACKCTRMHRIREKFINICSWNISAREDWSVQSFGFSEPTDSSSLHYGHSHTATRITHLQTHTFDFIIFFLQSSCLMSQIYMFVFSSLYFVFVYWPNRIRFWMSYKLAE